MDHPTTEQIRAFRKNLQTAYGSDKETAIKICAILIRSTPNLWERYESGDAKMSPGLFSILKRELGEVICGNVTKR